MFRPMPPPAPVTIAVLLVKGMRKLSAVSDQLSA
jgi:hypothetical protein